MYLSCGAVNCRVPGRSQTPGKHEVSSRLVFDDLDPIHDPKQRVIYGQYETAEEERRLKKMIYAVKRGRKTGIFSEWLKCFEQTNRYSNARFRRFEYRSELEEEPEDVPGSLRHAIKDAEEFLGDLVYLGESADYLEDRSWVEDGFLLYGDASEADDPEFFPDEREENEEDIEDVDEESDKELDTGRGKNARPTEYWAIVDDMKKCIDIIRSKQNDSVRAAAAANLRRHLKSCLSDVNLSELTAVYKDLEEENAIGYNPPAVVQFVARMANRYPVPQVIETEEAQEEAEDADSIQQLLMQTGAVECELKGRIFGQDAAIEKLRAAYFDRELTIRLQPQKSGPRNVFLLAGPPGVGKTFTAKLFAEKLGFPFRQFDMAGYSGDNAERELQGYARQYKDTASGGVLTEYVEENPRCVLLFDEIEKADGGVMRIFLQILEEGVCTDRFFDRNVSFKDAIIFFTTNAGRQLYSGAQNENLTLLPDKVVIDALEKDIDPKTGRPFFPSEILSRMSSYTVMMLNHLRADTILKLVEEDIKNRLKKIEKKFGYELKQGKEYVARTVLYSMGGSADARNASRIAGKFINREIYELLKLVEESQGLDASGMVRRIEWKCDIEDTAEEIRDLYFGERDCVIPVFGTVKYEPIGRIKNNNVHVKNTVDIDEFMKMIHNEYVLFAVIDYTYGLENVDNILNVVDARTIGRDVFLKLREENKEVPVYILDGSRGHEYAFNEKKALIKRGAEGFIESQLFRSQLVQTYEDVCCQAAMETLTARHQVLTYETKREFDEKTNVGSIIFCDFKLETAVESEDKSSILSDTERPNTKFNDVIGAEKAKEELQYFVKYLKEPRKFLMNGGKPPRGILLYGHPGTGKTMLARAMAGESDVAFLQTSATEFMNHYLGESEANIRRIFAKAKKYAPAIIFIDEIDAIGKKRTGSDTTHHTESMLNALLTEMDGFRGADSSKPVFVLAATNYGVGRASDGIDSLDDALLRRFDNKVYVDLPKESEREQYLLTMLAGKNITTVSGEAVHNIAERTTGQSLAILQNVFELAFRNAIKQSRAMTDDDLLTALEEYSHGEKKEYTPDYYKSVAIHETGHAYVSYIGGDKPSYITIESRGDHGGYMQHAQREDVADYTRDELLARIRTSLAGRAAEEVFYGKAKSLNTGSSSDLQYATDIAFQIVCTYGMEADQLITLRKEEVLQSALAGEYTAKVNEILKTEMKNTIAMIENAKDKIREIADVLIRENRLTGKQFEKLMEADG